MKQKIAFLILAHTDFTHLQRLCRALGSDDDIFIHIDQKTPVECFANRQFPDNVRIISRRVSVHWGDISVVKATLALIEEALSTGHNYLRLVLLSGACYPLKTVDSLRNHFMKHSQQNEIKYANGLEERNEFMWKVSKFHFHEPLLPGLKRGDKNSVALALIDKAVRKSASAMLRSFDRQFARRFPNMVPYFGSQFWAITMDCAKMVRKYVRDHPQFLKYHKYSWAPDEHFFHTIIGNSEFAGVTDGVVTHKGNGHELTNLHFIPRCLFGSFATFDELDLVLKSDKFFVRKTTTEKSGQLLEYLDRCVLSSETQSTRFVRSAHSITDAN